MKPHEVNEIDTTLAASTNGVIKLTMAEIFEGSRAEGRYLFKHMGPLAAQELRQSAERLLILERHSLTATRRLCKQMARC